MKTIFSSLVCLLLALSLHGQQKQAERTTLLSAAFLQFSEGANFGLVFSGPGLTYGLNWDCATDKRLVSYHFNLGFGALFSKGILGARFYLKPADLSYLLRINDRLSAGPVLKWEYNYNVYPDLQSGFDYWFTNISLGLGARYDLSLGDAGLRLGLHSSLAGLTSRQEAYRDPYFYDLGLGHALRHLHQDLAFGSFGSFLVGGFEALWTPSPGARHSFGYAMDYYGYFKSPGLTVLNHSVKMVIRSKNR